MTTPVNTVSLIKSVPKPISKEVVDILLDLLRQAVEGDLQSIAVAGVTVQEETFNCFHAGENGMLLNSELNILVRDFVDCVIQLRCPTNNPA